MLEGGEYEWKGFGVPHRSNGFGFFFPLKRHLHGPLFLNP